MLDLYHAMAGDDDEDAGPLERRLGRADLVMSFVNMGECGRDAVVPAGVDGGCASWSG
jgi:bone morphogenetic protein 8